MKHGDVSVVWVLRYTSRLGKHAGVSCVQTEINFKETL